jgi:hypothetical protein
MITHIDENQWRATMLTPPSCPHHIQEVNDMDTHTCNIEDITFNQLKMLSIAANMRKRN